MSDRDGRRQRIVLVIGAVIIAILYYLFLTKVIWAGAGIILTAGLIYALAPRCPVCKEKVIIPLAPGAPHKCKTDTTGLAEQFKPNGKESGTIRAQINRRLKESRRNLGKLIGVLIVFLSWLWVGPRYSSVRDFPVLNSNAGILASCCVAMVLIYVLKKTVLRGAMQCPRCGGDIQTMISSDHSYKANLEIPLADETRQLLMEQGRSIPKLNELESRNSLTWLPVMLGPAVQNCPHCGVDFDSPA